MTIFNSNLTNMNKENNNQTLVISYLTLRKSIGILGICLPAILLVGTLTFGHCQYIQESISHYYYTIMGDVFVGILSAVAIFLLSYKGYDKTDNIASSCAGLFALCVAFFPTSSNTDLGCSVLNLGDHAFRIYTHYISAALFFITLSYISLFLFTKSAGHETPQKLIRNQIYRVSGILIIVSIVLIFLVDNIAFLQTTFKNYKPVFWLEWCALASFGISWLTKGELLMPDKKEI